CASRRCRQRGATVPPARAVFDCGSGSRATSIGIGAELGADSWAKAKMSRVNRLIYALAISLLALGPASAAAAPTPSPSLDTVLMAPPTGYTELTSSSFHGAFTAHDYAVASDQAQAAEIEKTLNHDGFVDG